MKKYIPLLIITSLLLSACSIDWNDEKDKKIAELEKQIQDDIFKKKQECATYYPELKKQISELKKWTVDEKFKSLQEVFFSPKENKCFYTYRIEDNNGDYSQYRAELGQDPENSIGGDSCFVVLKKLQEGDACKQFNQTTYELKGE